MPIYVRDITGRVVPLPAGGGGGGDHGSLTGLSDDDHTQYYNSARLSGYTGFDARYYTESEINAKLAAPSVKELKINLDNNGSVLTSGLGTSYYTSTFSGTIVGWYITGYPAGSIVVDILKKAGDVPTKVDSIAGTEKPTLSSQSVNSDLSITTWTGVTVSPGDVFGIDIESVSTLTNCVITLKVQT